MDKIVFTPCELDLNLLKFNLICKKIQVFGLSCVAFTSLLDLIEELIEEIIECLLLLRRLYYLILH
jgi:hypothetical protein